MDELSSSPLLRQVQRRTSLNLFMRGFSGWLVKILAGLVLAALLSPTLYWALVAAAVLIAAGLTAAGVQAKSRRPSAYQAAQMADRAGNLQDRISTAVYFAGVEDRDPVLRLQRADAARHASRLDVRALFPLRAPAAATYSLVLLLLAGALFAYRLHSAPPLLALLQRAGRSPIVQAILTPIINAMNHDAAEEARRQAGKRGNGPDNAKNARSRGAQSEDAQANGRARSATQDSEAEARKREEQKQQEQQAAAAGSRGQGRERQAESEKSSDRSQQGGRGERAANSGENGERPQQGGKQGAEARSGSLAQSLLDAVKNLFSKPNAQQQSDAQQQAAENGQPRPQNGATQDGRQGQQGRGQSAASQQGQAPGQQGQQQGQNQQKGGLKAGTAQGSQEGTPNDFLGVKGTPEKVDVPVQQFTGQAQIRARVGDGVVNTPGREASTPQVAQSSGAEQENVPLRYRAYLQRYFDHARAARK